MEKKAVSGILLTLLLTSMLTLAFHIQTAKAELGTIYIRADGSIDPPTAPIQRNGDIYTLTGNITSDANGIVIERDNIVLDGAGYTVQSAGSGVAGSRRTKIVIKNMRIVGFGIVGGGIGLALCSETDIVCNTIAASWMGIILAGSSNNSITRNEITLSLNSGIWIRDQSTRNSIFANRITRNRIGIQFFPNSNDNNTIVGNDFEENEYGVWIAGSSSNFVYHNNFLNNTASVHLDSIMNIWNDGYPSGGNYWSDYTDVDLNNDGIWDHPYVIDANNQDNYPLVNPWTETLLRFRVGDYVRTTANLNVREGPGLGYALIDTMPEGTLGQIVGGPVEADGYVWWDVNYDAGVRGWSAEDWLEIYETSRCGKPVLVTRLLISEQSRALYVVGDKLIALFYIQNKGDAAITLDKLLVGGRINGGTLSNGKFPDFEPAGGELSVTLQPNEEQLWCGNLELTESGDYSFFVAYYIENPTEEEKKLLDENNWNTHIDLAEGLEDEARAVNLHVWSREEGISQLVAQETVGETRVTLSGQQYSILGLRSYIDPTTLDVISNTETKLYVDVEGKQTLAEPETARKIGLIDYARSIAGQREEILQTKETLVKLKEAFAVLKIEDLAFSAADFGISGMKLIRDMKKLSDILANIETLEKLGKAGLPQGVSGFVFTLLELALRGLWLDPFEEIKDDISNEFSQAIDGWNSVLTLLEGGEITDFSIARNLLSLQLSAKTHEGNVFYLLEKMLTNYCRAVDKIAGPILNFVTLDLFRFVELFWEAADVLDWTIELASRDIIAMHQNDAFLQFELTESAEYTLELSGVPQESINAYEVEYANLVAEGYAEAANAIAEILTIHLPIIGDISLESPGELRAYDSLGHVTGLVDGEEKNEIPYCWYSEGNMVFSDQVCCFEVVGKEEGIYGLKLERTVSGTNETVTFVASAIPTHSGAVHKYTIDWTGLSQAGEGVTVQVDSDGDGVFERTFTSDSELTQSEYIVATDNTPPETQLSIGEPKSVVSGITYLTSATPITVTAEDIPGGSGVASTAYRIHNATWNSGWTTYTEPFYLTGLDDGSYQIGFNSTDNAGNIEATNSIQVTLFSWNCIFEDTYGRGTTLKINIAYKFFQFITPDKDYGIVKATYMRQSGRAIIISHLDKQLQLITTAVDTKLDFCVAIAWDRQTRKQYFLLDKPGIEK
jgi:parallel beta-helix repeat protein